MPESGTYGSVRGVPGNRHPYRDRQHRRTARLQWGSNHQRNDSPMNWADPSDTNIVGLYLPAQSSSSVN